MENNLVKNFSCWEEKKDSGAMFGYLCRQNKPFMCLCCMGLLVNGVVTPIG